jgi:hypothetical protein
MAKKIIIALLIISMLATLVYAEEKKPVFKVDKQNGGIVPCLLGVFDVRMGYLSNQENVNVYLEDLLNLAIIIPVIGQIAWFVVHMYFGYIGYEKGKDISSFCIGTLGWKTANMMDKTKGRTIEWLAFIPIINIYSFIVYITETTGGKTLNQVISKENLRK